MLPPIAGQKEAQGVTMHSGCEWMWISGDAATRSLRCGIFATPQCEGTLPSQGPFTNHFS